MARSSKSNALKSKAKAKVSRGATVSPKVNNTKNKIKLIETKQGLDLSPRAKTSAAPSEPKKEEGKKVSQKLIETLEKRKKAAAEQKASSPFGRPAGRRGRRPKAMAEYLPENGREEEQQSFESEYEGLEYDTGIRVKQRSDENGFNLDRFEDFDEELNFDW